jgi:hypothetical protein
MAQPARLTLEEIDHVLRSGTVALATLGSSVGAITTHVDPLISEGSLPSNTVGFSDLESVIKENLLVSFAYSGYVCGRERYRRMVQARPTYTEASLTFGLVMYSDHTGAKLRQQYPATIVEKWTPPTNIKPYWFASMVRNSIAHSQIQFVSAPNQNRSNYMYLYNIYNANNETFGIYMNRDDFFKLIAVALLTFVSKVGPIEGYPPLSSLISSLRRSRDTARRRT